MASIRKRVQKNGSGTYRVDVRLKGFPPQRATFKRLTDAKKWGQHTEAAIREGRYFKSAESRKHTLGELIDRYILDVLPAKPKQADTQGPQLKWWRKQIGEYALGDVTPALITECRDRLLAGISKHGKTYSTASVNRYLAALSHALTVAVNEWGWMEDSPMRKVKRSTESRGRTRFLSDDERNLLLEVCRDSNNPYLYPVVVLALSTGMRRGEIMGLTWDDVDFNNGRIVLLDTKNGETRVVPLVGKALELLTEHAKVRSIHTNLLFPGKVKRHLPMDLRAPWQVALKEAEISDFRFHDLRHSAASYLVMNGASLAEIAEVLGHKTLQMVKRYAHLSEAHTAGVVASMNEKIFGGAE